MEQMKSVWIDFAGSLYLTIPKEASEENIKAAFFLYLNELNETHIPQFQFCEIDKVEEV